MCALLKDANLPVRILAREIDTWENDIPMSVVSRVRSPALTFVNLSLKSL